jgi:hypothetical protein
VQGGAAAHPDQGLAFGADTAGNGPQPNAARRPPCLLEKVAQRGPGGRGEPAGELRGELSGVTPQDVRSGLNRVADLLEHRGIGAAPGAQRPVEVIDRGVRPGGADPGIEKREGRQQLLGFVGNTGRHLLKHEFGDLAEIRYAPVGVEVERLRGEVGGEACVQERGLRREVSCARLLEELAVKEDQQDGAVGSRSLR